MGKAHAIVMKNIYRKSNFKFLNHLIQMLMKGKFTLLLALLVLVLSGKSSAQTLIPEATPERKGNCHAFRS